MDLGMFVVPFRLPETDTTEGLEWDLQNVRWAEEYGFTEVWFAEHFTLGWEPSCSPELMIAAAAQITEKIKLGAAANLLPYHNPVALAHRLMMLDHMTKGRFIAGFGAGAYESDAQLFALQDKDRREMMREALEIVLAIWKADGPFRIDGKYWTVDYPEYDDFIKGPNWSPFQKPHPRIAIAGVSPNSSTLKEAGRRGFIPMSFNVAASYLAGHWAAYAEGAAEGGHQANRRDWRVAREAFVAETDEEALRLAVGPGAPLARAYDEWVLPLYQKFGLLSVMAPGVPEDEINAEYLARHQWLIGAPDTVVERLSEQNEASGGFGVLLMMGFDYLDNPDSFRRSMELLATEVAPRIKDRAAIGRPTPV
jgi:alkanesulfonate monooxygenase SsuD/methylene tetrahydromethanopterin reductase-like flavin-dependent oxidoreductase (luciferase family)